MRTPSMVSDVSAIDVASTTLRRPGGGGAMARSCTSASSAPYSATTSTAGSLTRSRSKVSVRRISPAPGRNASTDPAPRAAPQPRRRPPAARSARADRGRDSASPPRRRGPALSITGASPSSFATRAPSMVADITRSLRSSRKPCCTSRASARPRSASSERSWNSSNRSAATPVERRIVEDHAREHALGDELDAGAARHIRCRSARDSRRSRPPPRPASPPCARQRRARPAGAAPAR